ncbi:MAG: phosphodiester glycosidase family protein, partial [Armatimonadota bacterium]
YPIIKPLADGVSLTQDIIFQKDSEQIITYISIDLANKNVKIAPALAKDVVMTNDVLKGREIVSAMVARKNALAGINADYFPYTGDPLGLCIIDGEMVSEIFYGRSVAAITDTNQVFFDIPTYRTSITLSNRISRQIDGINRGRETNQVLLYTGRYGTHTMSKFKGTEIVITPKEDILKIGTDIECIVNAVYENATNTVIPAGSWVLSSGGPAAWFLKENLKPGDTVVIRVDIGSTQGNDFSKVQQAVGGGPMLVKDSTVYVDWSAQGFNDSFSNRRHPRTAIGVTKDNKLILLTVDGRQSISRGMTLQELANYMLKIGCVNAMNLDGGGSTSMSIGGWIINSPSEGSERPVANALLVYAKPQIYDTLDKLSFAAETNPMTFEIGAGIQQFLVWSDEAQMLTDEQLSKIIWGTKGGVGFINQQGYFTPTKERKGKLGVMYGNQSAEIDIKVIKPVPIKEETPTPKPIENGLTVE